MKKNLDQWNEIADLINKDKKRALDDFRIREFVPGDLPAPQTESLFRRLRVMRPSIMAVAAFLLLAVGLFSFWLLRGSRQKVPAVSGLDNLLADSFLYKSVSEPEKKVPEFHDVSTFSSALSVLGAEAGFNHAAPPAAKPIDPSVPVEHGDPAALHRRMEKIIRENTIERMLAQFCQIGKEA